MVMSPFPPPASQGAHDLAALAPARRDLYRFLSAAFLAAPAPEFLAKARDEEFLATLAEWFSAEVVKNFRQAGETMETKEFPQVAHREFTHLFLVPGGQYLAPYESVFRDRREMDGREIAGLLLGASAVAVQQWYRLAALEISAEFKELPDHIGLELHYLAYLCAKEQEFAALGDSGKQTRAREMQRDFLKAHLLTWLPNLENKIRANASISLYPAIAGMAVEFCRAQLVQLEAVDGPGDGRPLPSYSR
jgi:TorA maturation chaperone TorD